MSKMIIMKKNIDDVIFREVQIGDVSFLASLMGQLGYPIGESAMNENIQNYISLPNQKAWVAEKNGEVVGCIAVAITNYFHRQASFLRVITMIVDQKNRRIGVGKGLMSIAEKYALEQRCSHIELTSGAHRAGLGSHAFYQSLGYMDLYDKKKYFAKKL